MRRAEVGASCVPQADADSSAGHFVHNLHTFSRNVCRTCRLKVKYKIVVTQKRNICGLGGSMGLVHVAPGSNLTKNYHKYSCGLQAHVNTIRVYLLALLSYTIGVDIHLLLL